MSLSETSHRRHAVLTGAILLVMGVVIRSAGAAPPVPGMERAGSTEQGQDPAPKGSEMDDPGLLQRLKDDISRSEYEIRWQPSTRLADLSAAFHAPNRAQGFRTYFTPSGLRVIPRLDEAPSWELSLHLSGVGRHRDVLAPASDASLHVDGDRIEYARGRVKEWYRNAPEGLEQGFTLEVAPEGSRDAGGVAIEMALEGDLSAFATDDARAIDFRDAEGTPIVRLAELRVTDARGRELPSGLQAFAEGSARGVRIVFDDREASYPVSVDPFLETPDRTWVGDQDGAYLGISVATAGDVNGDGYSDVIVGAYLYDNGQTNEGRAYVYQGSPSGPSATASWTAESNQSASRYGFSVATAGDVNGDGYADVIVGAYGYNNPESNEGRAFVYLGSSSGLTTTPAWTGESNQAEAYYGVSVATAGDVNGDGYSDILVGAELFDNGQTDEGRAYAYYGSAAGLSATPSWTVEGNLIRAELGTSVATAGDVNGDGYADVIIGGPGFGSINLDQGTALIYHGGPAGLTASAVRALQTLEDFALFGNSVSTAGDVNGDGYADVIVGAYHHTGSSSEQGMASVYLGSASGVSSTPFWTVEGSGAGDHCGVSVATAGDVDGNGYADVIVGSSGDDFGETDIGSAAVYTGSSTGLSSYWNDYGTWAGDQFGGSVAPAGDVNGDGYADFLVGAAAADEGPADRGAAYLYYGHGVVAARFHRNFLPPTSAAVGFGASVSGAGDVNGDGFADAVVGAPDYDNGQVDEGRIFVFLGSVAGLSGPVATREIDRTQARFGASVAGAGDVNGDGYADVIVGAPTYSTTAGDLQEGGAFLYMGSSAGILSAAPVWSASADQANANFGISVAGAGDVNGDGYADVLVGAETYDHGQSDEGRAFLYQGSAGGLSAAPFWTAESDRASAFFGHSVASAGDVDRDGFSDVVVGAPFENHGQVDEGRAYLFRGSPGGLSPAPPWTAEKDQSAAHFGSSVAAAGDVNGDGYSDVLVAADRFDTGQTDAGGAFVYLGSASGPAAVPMWSVFGAQREEHLGSSISAGDINGDGYADILIGCPGHLHEPTHGRALLYSGSPTGPSPDVAYYVTVSNLTTANGSAVSIVGDVNADGFADVLVGDPPGGSVGEGQVFSFFGNKLGKTTKAQQTRVAGGSIVPLGASEAQDGFHLHVEGRTPFGRGRVRMQYEAKPLAGFLNSSALVTTSSYVDTGTSVVPFDATPAGFSADAPLHWRARIRYDPIKTPFSPGGPWRSGSQGGWQQASLRTAAPVPGQVSQLLVTKPALPSLTLSWTPSCAGDANYEIYEGLIGSYYSHTSIACSTAGSTMAMVIPSAGNRYYLIAATNGYREGPYGQASNASEIPQVPGGICRPRTASPCP